jgi:hypothetical protein
MRHAMPLRSFVFLFLLLVFSSAASAESFDGKYEGKMILTKGGDECGAKSDAFVLEVKGGNVRIVSQRTDKPLEGKIQNDGQFFAGGTTRTKNPIEFRGQILASTKTGLGSVLQKADGICQFLTSFKRN